MGGGPVKRLFVGDGRSRHCNLYQPTPSPFRSEGDGSSVCIMCVPHAQKEDQKRRGLIETLHTHTQPTAVKELTGYRNIQEHMR